MSKTSVKVEIPEKQPDKLTGLAEKVNKKHKELGTASPLKLLDMEKFDANLTDGIGKREQAKKLHDEAESLNQQAGLSLGIDKSQNVKTPGTVYSTLASVRDVLLGIYKGQEKKLSEWGFDVVISDITPNSKVTPK